MKLHTLPWYLIDFMTWRNIGVVEYSVICLPTCFHVLLRVVHILSSIDLMTVEVVLRLVIKYATSPRVLKCIPNAAPPGADDSWPSCEAIFRDCRSVCADFEV